MLDKMITEVFPQNKLDNLYKALKESNLDLEQYECLCLPYVGKEYRTAKKQMLFIGKANSGWGEKWDERNVSLDNLSDVVNQNAQQKTLAEISIHVVENKIIPSYAGLPVKPPFHDPYGRYKKSHVFHMIYRFTSGILDRNPVMPDITNNVDRANKSFLSMSWSNIFKVCQATKQNPDELMIKFLLRNLNTLAEEIKRLKPSCVIFCTGYDWDKYINAAFPSYNLAFRELTSRIPAQDASIITGLPNVPLAVRTRHPQGWPSNSIEILYQEIFRRIYE